MDLKKEVAWLKRKLERELDGWVVDKTNIELFRDDPPQVFQAYLGGEDNAHRLSRRADKLLPWHFNQYGNAVLNEKRYPREDFALCARYARAVVEFETAYVNADQGGSVLSDQAVFNFSLNVLAGWRADAAVVGNLLYKGLDTSLLDLRHNDQHQAGMVYRHFWFLMHLYCETANIKLDISKYSYPEDMSPYKEVLADWRTSDLAKVQRFVTAMADFHVMETRDTEHDEIAEFDNRDYMLFPHEILTFLRLREQAGLANPTSFEHPLMNQPLAKLPAPLPLARPATPLLDKVIEKFRQQYPGSFAQWV